jgi:hypothetical protein
MQTELLLVVIAKALLELAGMFLLGRGVLYLLAGAKREQNLFYQILCVVTNPFVKLTRLITPKVVLDKHIPLATFILVLWLWAGLVFWLLPDLCGRPDIDCKPLLERKTG